MSDDLKERLRFKHNDTWPIKIGYGDLVNEDGPEAASRIEKLEAALAKIAQHDMQALAMDALRPGDRIRKAPDAE
jgi:hypothetical protein